MIVRCKPRSHTSLLKEIDAYLETLRAFLQRVEAPLAV
jgi:hypothetical protein